MATATDRAAARQKQVEAEWRLLALAAKGKACSDVVKLEWVENHLLYGPDEIAAESVPSPGALALLQEAKKDRRWFFGTILAKAKAAGTNPADAWEDDGRVLKLIDDFEEGFAAGKPKGGASIEDCLPPEKG